MKSFFTFFFISTLLTGNISAQIKETLKDSSDSLTTIPATSLSKMMRVTSIPRDITKESSIKNIPQLTMIRITSIPKLGENKTRRTYDSLIYRYNRNKRGFWNYLGLKKKSEASIWAILYPDPSMEMSSILTKISNPYIKLIVTNFNQELIYENEWFPFLQLFSFGEVLPPGGYIVNAMGEDQIVVLKFIKK